MELRQLKTFTVITRTGSFTKAAEQLGYAQSSVTTHIHALESELGVELFDRFGPRTGLTLEGKKLLGYAEQVLRLIDEAQAAISPEAEPQGALTIGAGESLATHRLPHLLREYRRRYPKVELVFKNANCTILREMLRRNEIDAAFFIDRPLNEPDLIVTTLSPEKMVLLTSRHHRLRRDQWNFPADLAGECLILTEPGCSYRASIETILSQHQVHPASTLEISGIESIKQMVLHDLGVAVLPAFVAERELEASSLVAVDIAGSQLDYWIQFAYHKNKWRSPALRELIAVTEALFLQGSGSQSMAAD